MDKQRIAETGKACFIASCKGYIGSFDTEGERIRMVMVSPDGFRVAGEFMDDRYEAMESCAKEFMKAGIHHDTSSKETKA